MNPPIERRGLLAAGPPTPELAQGVRTFIGTNDYAEAIGRKPAFPLYLFCYGGCTPTGGSSNLRRTLGYEPGRVLICTQGENYPQFSDALWSQLCVGDVPLAWLYERHDGPGEVPLVEGHNEIEAAIRDFGPQVRAVLVANDTAETGFIQGSHMGFVGRKYGGSDEERSVWVERCTEFVKRAGGRMRDLGARPAFGLYHFHALLHAYWADAHYPDGDPLRKAVQDLDALLIIFMGYSFWMCAATCQPLEHWDPHGVIVPKALLGAWPSMILARWLRSMECWGGVGYIEGLREKHDIAMAQWGFKAGVIGELPDGSR